MGKLYILQPGQKSKKTTRPSSVIWKEMLLLSCLLNCLQLIAYIIKH